MEERPVPAGDGRHPWDRQMDESDQDYARFVEYLQAGPSRTQKQIARDAGLTPAAISLTARAHRWKDRARAYDSAAGTSRTRPDHVVQLAEGLDPWEIQPGETDKIFGYFQTYLQLGRTRTPRKTTEKLNNQARESGAEEISREAVQHYSSRFRWAERAAAFDRHMDAQWAKAVIEHGRRMVQEHLKAGRALLAKAEAALGVITPEELSPGDAVKFLDLYSRLTRVALGEPETSVSVSGPKGGPVQVAVVPEDEGAREQQLRAASLEIAQRLGLGVALAELDEEAILALPE